MISKLNQPVNNVALSAFRVFYGLCLAAEGFGAIMTGWVRRTFVETSFNFQFFGFEWLDVFHGTPMYVVFVGLGLCGLMIAFGWHYRWGAIGYAVLWSITYLGQKCHYNNHYYLMFLLSWAAVFIPMHSRFSLDVKQGRVKGTNELPFYLSYFFVAMFAVVYFYAAKNKIYPDWLDGRFITQSMLGRNIDTVEFLDGIVNSYWFPVLVAYSAVLYDALIVPALIWKKTRKLAIAFSFVFHMYNSIVYQVGVFPYLSLSVLLFFVGEQWLERWVKREKDQVVFKMPLTLSPYAFLLIITLHIAVPLRHHMIPGNVFYTEEGHRLSWRMMLRLKRGNCSIYTQEEGKKKQYFNYHKELDHSQSRLLYKCPDVLYAYVQRIKKEQKSQGKDVAIYANVKVGLNGRKFKQLVNPDIDLAKVKWNYFGHNDWVNSYDFEE